MCLVAGGLSSPDSPPNAPDKLNWTIFGKVPATCTAFYLGQLQLPSDFICRSSRVGGSRQDTERSLQGNLRDLEAVAVARSGRAVGLSAFCADPGAACTAVPIPR